VRGARGVRLLPAPMRIPRRARSCRVRHDRAPHGAPGRVHQSPPAPLGARLSTRHTPRGGGSLVRPVAVAHGQGDSASGTARPRAARPCPTRCVGGTHGYIVDPPPQARTRHEHEAHAESGRAVRMARGCRPRPRRSHAGHGTTRAASAPCPTRCAGAPCTRPPAPLGARLSARREPRGLRTTARPVAPTRARGALVSVSLARLGHEKVSSTLMYARALGRRTGVVTC